MNASLVDEAKPAFLALAAANRAFNRKYPGPTPDRQPIHTVYGGAHLFRAETAVRLGSLALDSMKTYGRDPVELALGVGFVKDPSALRAGAAALTSAFQSNPA